MYMNIYIYIYICMVTWGGFVASSAMSIAVRDRRMSV